MLYLAAAGILNGCILPYEPSLEEMTSDIMVVEAMLAEPSGTYVRIGYLQPMNPGAYPVTYSSSGLLPDDGSIHTSYEVSILGSDGSGIPLRYGLDSIAGIYSYRPEAEIRFAEGVDYALDIDYGDRHYRSDYITPMRTPAIDDVNYLNFDGGHQINIRVSTHDPDGKALFYLWRYEEDWEIRAEFFATMRYDPALQAIVEGMTLETADNRYYCWGRNRSNSLILGNAERMLGGEIRDHTVLNIWPSGMDSRFSYLYSILVKQYALPPDAYLYFDNLRKNTEETNSIFASMPVEMQGNIWCVSDPDEPVIGYFFAATESASRLYIDAADVPAMKPEIYCEPRLYPYTEDPFMMYMSGFGLLSEQSGNGYLWLPNLCLDCTRHNKATKTKPLFWPNNHL